jgi:3-methyl-2-oxobutanoate hydroxymethyltransferase
MRKTLLDLRKQADAGRRIAVLTCYDATFAAVFDAEGIDALMIGDSLGMVIQGHDTPLPVTVEDVIYHTSAVARGASTPWIIADMPFGSYQEGPQQAFRNAARLLAAGAQMVKLEGGQEMAETCRFLVARGIPVCGHIGLTPQSVHQFGGFRVQGKTPEDAARLLADAKALEEAGCAMLVIEGVPRSVGDRLADATRMMTIGIGASARCTGQVLVFQDMLGLAVKYKPARFVRNFMEGTGSVQAAARAYIEAVREGTFPAEDQLYPG